MNTVIASSILSKSSANAAIPAGVFPALAFELAQTVRAGFPEPAEDIGAKRVDLAARLIKHPQATFLIGARGDSTREAGIFDGDGLVVDKPARARCLSIRDS